MSVTVLIPTPLRQYAGNRRSVEADGDTVAAVLADLVRRHDRLARHLLDESGAVRSFVNVYLNQEDVRHLANGETAVRPGDVLTIVPSVAGGSGEPWPS
jgi:adenylyltransferase/sulfurtransferase